MIPRYSRKEMAALFDDGARYRTWLDVELAVCDAMERRGEVPAGTSARSRSKVKIDPALIEEPEETIRDDVIAFLTHRAATAGDDARHRHRGIPSSEREASDAARRMTAP